MKSPLVLASASPRRAELLRGIGLDFSVRPSGASEIPLPDESPAAHAGRLAEEKARHVHLSLDGTGAIVLGADTVVTVDGKILGKPRDDADARSMLALLSGREHHVLTGIFLIGGPEARAAGRVVSTLVRFRRLSAAFLDWYVSTGETRDKAGAYGIQDHGVLLADRIEGSWSNVVGLPLEALPALFAEIGVDFLERLRR